MCPLLPASLILPDFFHKAPMSVIIALMRVGAAWLSFSGQSSYSIGALLNLDIFGEQNKQWCPANAFGLGPFNEIFLCAKSAGLGSPCFSFPGKLDKLPMFVPPMAITASVVIRDEIIRSRAILSASQHTLQGTWASES